MAAGAADHHAADRAAEAAAWAGKWSAWYAQYVARAAEQSERTGRLYHDVADAMSHGSLPPIFCFTPTLGGPRCYRHLARHLGSEQPFFVAPSVPPFPNATPAAM